MVLVELFSWRDRTILFLVWLRDGMIEFSSMSFSFCGSHYQVIFLPEFLLEDLPSHCASLLAKAASVRRATVPLSPKPFVSACHAAVTLHAGPPCRCRPRTWFHYAATIVRTHRPSPLRRRLSYPSPQSTTSSSLSPITPSPPCRCRRDPLPLASVASPLPARCVCVMRTRRRELGQARSTFFFWDELVPNLLEYSLVSDGSIPQV